MATMADLCDRYMMEDISEDGIRIARKKRQKLVIYELTPELAAVVDAVKSSRKKVTGLYLLSTRGASPISKKTGRHPVSIASGNAQ